MPVFADIHPEEVAIFIPIIFVLGGVVIAIVAVVINGKNKNLHHRERLIAMEKGIPIPEPPHEEKKPVHSGRRAGGLVMTGLGLALTFALTVAEGFYAGVWGLMPTSLGVGLLIAAHFDKREYDARVLKTERDKERHSTASAVVPRDPVVTDDV